jgi:hypothetical protein
MTRSQELQNFLNQYTKRAFGRTMDESTAAGVCVTCGQPVGEFKDALSRKEFTISGMCQVCQDSIFGCLDGEEL